MTDRLSTIAAWIQQRDEELLYSPDGEAIADGAPHVPDPRYAHFTARFEAASAEHEAWRRDIAQRQEAWDDALAQRQAEACVQWRPRSLAEISTSLQNAGFLKRLPAFREER